MEFLVSNWFLIVALIVVVTVSVMGLIKIIKTPSSRQLDKVKQWLLYAIIEAEKIYGSNVGAIKLRFVYDIFLTRFKWLSAIISFEMFSKLVDESLETMREMLETNKSVKKLVEGETKEKSDK